MSIYWFNREELLKKAKTKYHNKGGKEKVSIIRKIKKPYKKKQKTSIKI